MPATSRPSVNGSAITSHPAKWLLFTNGPNGSRPGSSSQKPYKCRLEIDFCTKPRVASTAPKPVRHSTKRLAPVRLNRGTNPVQRSANEAYRINAIDVSRGQTDAGCAG